MTKKRITIKDVSLESGLSIGTVSRFIRNTGYVSEEAREKIQAAIEKLQYIPNAAARNMVNKKSRIVGIAVPEINNPFLAELMISIEEDLSKMGYSVMLCNTGFDPDKATRFIDDLIMRDAEGIVLAATDIICTDQALIHKINRYMCGISVGQRVPNFDSVNFADRQLGYQMTEYLIRQGHRRIAFIGYNQYASQTIERKEGYVEALNTYHIPVRSEYMAGFDRNFPYVVGKNGGYFCAKKVLKEKEMPTAIVATNDFSAIGAYKAVKEAGLKVGQDISIVGFDNIDIAENVDPPLTTVNCDTKLMADQATKILDQRINGKEKERQVQEVILTADFVCRESVKKLNTEI